MTKQELARVLELPYSQELLNSSKLTHLAYNGTDRLPRSVPVGFIYAHQQIVICTAPNAPKVAALSKNPQVALSIDIDATPPHILLIRGQAVVDIVDGVAKEFLLGSKKYIPQAQWLDFEEQSRKLYRQMARITVTPLWAKLIDFETTRPVAIAQLVHPAPPK